MPAIIRFPDGLEATLLGKDGKWECTNRDVKVELNFRTKMLPHRYYPHRVNGLAEDIAKEMGAEVIQFEPFDDGPLDPDAEY